MMLIRTETAKLLKEEFQIDPEVTAIMFEEGFLRECECRNVLIRNEYKKKAQSKERMRLRTKLADKYCVSVSLIEKVVL